jgi:predicted transcriptional regulator
MRTILEEIREALESLRASDYKAIKYAEGLITAEEYEPIKVARQQLRDRINQLEQQLNA